MLKKYFVLINWRPKSPVKMLPISRKVALNMRGNKGFPSPPVTSDDHNAANDRLDEALTNRKNGPAARIALKDVAAEVDDILRKNAAYVDDTSDGSEAMVQSSGYAYSNGEKTPVEITEVPAITKMTSKGSAVTITCKKPKRAKTLCWVVYNGGVITPVNIVNNNVVGPIAENVIIVNPGQARLVLKGLKPGDLITAMVCAENSAGKSGFSIQQSVFVNK